MRKWLTRMREKHVDDVSRTYRSTAIFSYTRLVWGSLRLAPIIILGYVEHTRGEPSLRASVYIISHHTCYISRCTDT